MSNRLKVQFFINECILRGVNDDRVAIAQCKRNLYQFMEVYVANAAKFEHSHEGGNPMEIWHRRLSHLNVKSTYALEYMVRGMNLDGSYAPTSTLICKACSEGEQYVMNLGNNAERRATKSLEIVHSGVCGPMKNMHGRGKVFFYFYL